MTPDAHHTTTRSVFALILAIAALIVLSACGASQRSADAGARIQQVIPTLNTDLVQIEVLVETRIVQTTGRDRKNVFVPNVDTNVTLTGPAGTNIDQTVRTGRDGVARFQLAQSLSKLDALRPGQYLVNTSRETDPRILEITPAEIDALIIAGEQRLLEATGPNVGQPRAIIDAFFHPVGRPKDSRELYNDAPKGGDQLELTVTARSVGDGPLYQLTGTVEARGPAAYLRRQRGRGADDTLWFHPIDLQFGKLEPGESATLILPINIPRAVESGPLDIVVTWNEHNENTPEELRADLPQIAGLQPPVIVVDYTLGNDDEPINGQQLALGRETPVSVSITPFGGGEPVALVLALETDTPDTVEITTAQSRVNPAEGQSPIPLGPVMFKVTQHDKPGRIRVRVLDDDFGELWTEVFPVRSPQGVR